jgi:adenylate kinase family enzyme
MRSYAPTSYLPIGRRIHIIGNSCSGKSTLGARLARFLEAPLVELDALNWEPGWVSLASANPTELERRIQQATQGEAWVVAGSYKDYSQRIFWPRLHSVIWLDLPMPLLLWRVLRRSWRRWRTRELLWGANYERFWPQLKIWNQEESLISWIIQQHQRKRQDMLADTSDPRWAHIRFIQLKSPQQISAFTQSVEGNPLTTGKVPTDQEAGIS